MIIIGPLALTILKFVAVIKGTTQWRILEMTYFLYRAAVCLQVVICKSF